MPSSADAMFRLSVCFARFWDPPFRWLLVFYQNVLNMCFERNVSFSFSTLSRNKTNTTLRSDPAFCSAYTVQTCVRAMQDHSFGVCVCCGHAGRLDRPFQLKVRETWAKRKMLGEKPCHSTRNHRGVRSSTLYTSVRSGILSRIAIRSHMLLFSVSFSIGVRSRWHDVLC